MKKIAIIGAGIAGLTLANLLKKNSDFLVQTQQSKKTETEKTSYISN